MIDEERQDEGAAPEEPAEERSPDTEAEAAEQQPAEEPAPEAEPPAEEPAAEEPAPEAEPPAEEPAAEEPQAPEQPAADEPADSGQPTADEPAEPAPDEPADSGQPTADTDKQRRERGPREEGKPAEPDVVPGAHLEPDLVLEEQAAAADAEFPGYQEDVYEAQPESAEEGAPEAAGDGAPAETPAARTPLDLAADARYQATGKRKTSVARVILKPGNGSYTINGRELDEFFPRATLRKTARQPLETAGYETRMDVIAKIHGGGVSAQAGALRHGVARALVEADPNLRGELKRRGFLTRDARAKERKKAGLKKARKRPQFSKR
jgi:small subunit ribosomal protein S9